MILWVHLTHTAHNKLFMSLLDFLLNPLIVISSQLSHVLKSVNIRGILIFEVFVLQRLTPVYLVKVKEHLLFEFILSVVDSNRVVVLA